MGETKGKLTYLGLSLNDLKFLVRGLRAYRPHGEELNSDLGPYIRNWFSKNKGNLNQDFMDSIKKNPAGFFQLFFFNIFPKTISENNRRTCDEPCQKSQPKSTCV